MKPYARLRYFLGGNRPSQTTPLHFVYKIINIYAKNLDLILWVLHIKYSYHPTL